MDWLRSEDLKEEKNVSTPITMIAGAGTLCILRFSTGCEAYYLDYVEITATRSRLDHF
jgi:hypothetical protein